MISETAMEPIATATGSSSAASTGAVGVSWIQLHESMQLLDIAVVQSASSWQERINQLPLEERQYLEAKNTEYFNALEFGSVADQRKLIEQGFPMPEEWVAAQALSEGELKYLAQQGNIKAQMFYVDRVIGDVAPVLKERGFDNTDEDRELYAKFNEASAMSSIMLKKTRSPFVAYQNGLLLSVGTIGHSPAVAAGSFQVAKELGDTRADFLSQMYFDAHAGLDPQVVMASYSSIKSVLGR
ncbi:MAG: hypothetical protein QM612_11930 [Thermomonas sp.]|uniref:hypothetical protein n=1 Tax=Thermomonas sp. TaxID=1971895 RepID=UPI0039E4E8C0